MLNASVCTQITHIKIQQADHGLSRQLFRLIELLLGQLELFVWDFTLTFLLVIIVQATSLHLLQMVLMVQVQMRITFSKEYKTNILAVLIDRQIKLQMTTAASTWKSLMFWSTTICKGSMKLCFTLISKAFLLSDSFFIDSPKSSRAPPAVQKHTF